MINYYKAHNTEKPDSTKKKINNLVYGRQTNFEQFF